LIFSSESVTIGHPDKLADQISDAILDELIRRDKHARVAVETLLTRGLALIAGEISTKTYIEIPEIVRKIIYKVGYNSAETNFNAKSVSVLTSISEQSPDISRGINLKNQKIGAGDQGIMFGYACRETPELMPLPIQLAHKLTNQLAKIRQQKILDFLRPDGKAQVSVEYDSNQKPKRVATVVVSTQHTPQIKITTLRQEILQKIIQPTLKEFLDSHTKILINPTGRFVYGGPPADSGLTGRKIIVDTYGGAARHGGGCFSGKDPTKVDRSAAYAARWVAKNVVAAGLADRVEIQIAYAIGHPKPISIFVETFGTAKIEPTKIAKIIDQTFDLSPAGILRDLKLRQPIYLKTATNGHFGKSEFPWEKTNKVKEILNIKF
jgi:S-adenosylmethionine synthetase